MQREAMQMPIQTQELHPGLAADAGNPDLSRPLDDDAIAEIQAAIDAWPVLVFRDQHLTDTQLRDFAARFGPLEIGRSAARPGRRRLAIPQIGDVSNLDEDNNVRALSDRRRLDGLGNRLWHTDASYMPVPVVLGLLHAVALPPPSPFGNGETEFADMRAAYDALPAKTKDAIDTLTAEHDIFWSRAQIGFTEFAPGEREQYPPSPGSPPSGIGAQEPVPVGARLAHHRVAGCRRAPAAGGPEHPRDAASFRLQSHLADRRSGDLGQSLDHASRAPA
jgi:alpha-ketoglutarate-dependent 2,4-dichlorophenoxyacetate dioxygenase